jgi:hypothetical protein
MGAPLNDRIDQYRSHKNKVQSEYDKGLITPSEAADELINKRDELGITHVLPREDVIHLNKLITDKMAFNKVKDSAVRTYGEGTPEAYDFIKRNFHDRREN